MDPMSLIFSGASLLGGALGGIFGGGNPNEWAMGAAQDYDREAATWLDPNKRFYREASNSYYRDLSRTLGGLMPGTNSLLSATGRMQGGSYGGSVMQANLLRKDMITKGFDIAGQSTERFGNSLYAQGLNQYQNLKGLGAQMRNIYAGGNVEGQQYGGSFNNALMGLGGGLLSRANFNFGGGWDGGPGWMDDPLANNPNRYSNIR